MLDYKSADAAKTPDETHRNQGGWIDLQLPLYRHLVRALGIEENVQFGYIQLPKDVARTDFALAEWTADELHAADEAAASEVVRQMRRGVFWPPATPAPAFCEDFSAICQDGRIGAAAPEGNAEEVAP